ncbi:DNA phosphorothioation-dependent restriction protein DptG [Halalkalibacter okhensis]|uniref:DNA phosphorothioation-dependent restriction protein DptG n=1 Tax=Halalkalibacter okhensis TaxID=333138 RepID=A0A0B0INA2_9BACI|nr:DNA phosphorothioation-dependent restriction protein DptG [Halalkalibacter okhensis]KHF41549.1 hypothetical protein LQ50_02215 [Halalkalibacter okhensis]
MDYRLDIDTLKELIKNQHKTGEINSVLPFAANEAKILLKGEFKTVLGEFTRQVSKQALENENDPLLIKEPTASYGGDEGSIIKKMTSNVKFQSEDDRHDLERLLQTLLFTNEKDIKAIKAIHPHIFMYYPLSEKKKGNLEKKVGTFLKDVLVGDNASEVSAVFNKDESEDILVSLILDHLNFLKEANQKKYYQALLPSVKNLFMKDFLLISKHKDFFIDHLQTLLNHYYFVYVSQLAFKFNLFNNADYSVVNPLYYTLEWESLNKRRKAFSDPLSFKGLRDRAEHVFPHMYTQAYYSHIMVNKDKKFMTYSELDELLNSCSEEERKKFIHDANIWIKYYADTKEIPLTHIAETHSEAFTMLYQLLKKGMSSEVCKNYGRLIEDAASGEFLKFRGSLGYTLNINQDFLLMITALAVGEERILLKQLFEEFNKRGITLDLNSQKEVVELLDNLNFIEKKSDSGDAQYVKPIL